MSMPAATMRRFGILLLFLSCYTGFSAIPASGHWQLQGNNASSTLSFWSAMDVFVTTMDQQQEDDAKILHVDVAFTPGEHPKNDPEVQWINVSAPLSGNACATNLVTSSVFAPNPFMGLRFLKDAEQSTCFLSVNETRILIEETQQVHASTGLRTIRQIRDLHISSDSSRMVYNITRSSRTGAPMSYILEKASSLSFLPFRREYPSKGDLAAKAMQRIPYVHAREISVPLKERRANTTGDRGQSNYIDEPPFLMYLDDDFDVHGGLSEKSLLLSLQGLANSVETTEDGAVLYFVYPEDWDFTYTPAFRDYLESGRPDAALNVAFTVLSNASAVVAAVAPLLQPLSNLTVVDYVLWDPEESLSLPVAYTAAGVHRALVLTEGLVDLVSTALVSSGLTLSPAPIVDLRGRFVGMTAAEIFSWAYDKFANSTSKTHLVMLGGEGGCEGESYKHGVADWGVSQQSFFFALNTDPNGDADEYALAQKIMRGQDEFSFLFGWHLYCKDLEATYTTMASQHSLRVEGLSTLPNFSFMHRKALAPDFKFENSHNDFSDGNLEQQNISEAGESAQPITYLTCVQTDSLGLGAWLSPSRGTIPYAWETPLNYFLLAPVILEMYYSQRSQNDLMIGAISGPGYNYPKAVPPENLPTLLNIARNITDALDISIFESMDDSEGSTVVGNPDLTQDVVDAYFDAFPQFTGFIHGYAPSFTFAESPSGQAYMSFDYYLAPEPTVDEVVADILELSKLNNAVGAPYFLCVHVREWSDISRVEEILKQLPKSEFEVVPLDVFLSFAGSNPTFEPHVEMT